MASNTSCSRITAKAITLVAGLGALIVLASSAEARPKAELWPRWNVHNELSEMAPDHSIWNDFLEAYTHHLDGGATCFDYRAVRAPDHAVIDAYIGYLEGFPVSKTQRDHQLSYWINLYNAVTVRTVLRHYPVNSIRDINISPGWFASGPWGAKLVTVEGHDLSLDDIEHRILRPIWRDPRIHYALNCASIGCPDLAPYAYMAGNIDNSLDRAAQSFVTHSRAATSSGTDVRLSSIYKWYREDFGGDDQAVLGHIRHHAQGDRRDDLDGASRIRGYDYDWSLNDCYKD